MPMETVQYVLDRTSNWEYTKETSCMQLIEMGYKCKINTRIGNILKKFPVCTLNQRKEA